MSKSIKYTRIKHSIPVFCSQQQKKKQKFKLSAFLTSSPQDEFKNKCHDFQDHCHSELACKLTPARIFSPSSIILSKQKEDNTMSLSKLVKPNQLQGLYTKKSNISLNKPGFRLPHVLPLYFCTALYGMSSIFFSNEE